MGFLAEFTPHSIPKKPASWAQPIRWCQAMATVAWPVALADCEKGLAWSPDGEEVWFTGNKSGIDRALYAVSLAGKERLVARMLGTLMLRDIWKEGRLLNRASWPRELTSVADGKERDLTWLDYSYPADISTDGKTLLFDEQGGGSSLRTENPAGLIMPCTRERRMALRPCF
jgi:hypothetical protein